MTTSPSDLTGLFKEAYPDDIVNLVPDVAKFVKKVPFVPRDKETGNLYHQPVIVSQEHGVTYASPTDGAFALEDAISMTMQDAQIQGSQMLLRSSLSYDAAARASNSKKAFVKATELLVENMLESMTKRLEIACYYGGSGLATTASSTNQSATQTRVTMTAATWAAGIWSGSENAKLNFYDTGVLVSSGADAVFTVAKVDTNNRYVYVNGTATGITALDAAILSDPTTVVAYFKNAFGKEMSGIDTILTNTGSLFNINAGTYNLWAGNTSTVSGQLTFGKILSAIGLSVDRGLEEEVDVDVNPKTWANLATDLAALRMYDQSYSDNQLKIGSESIAYHGQNGRINVNSHNIVKAGEAFWYPAKRMKRIGAQEISFKTPGREDEIFLHLPSNAGFELRLYCDQAVFFETPPKGGKITGFTNV